MLDSHLVHTRCVRRMCSPVHRPSLHYLPYSLIHQYFPRRSFMFSDSLNVRRPTARHPTAHRRLDAARSSPSRIPMGTCGAQHALICVGACTLVEMDIRLLVHARLRRITIPIQNASAYLPPPYRFVPPVPPKSTHASPTQTTVNRTSAGQGTACIRSRAQGPLSRTSKLVWYTPCVRQLKHTVMKYF